MINKIYLTGVTWRDWRPRKSFKFPMFMEVCPMLHLVADAEWSINSQKKYNTYWRLQQTRIVDGNIS